MADNDSSIIKPVENLQNIPILTPAEGHEQRSNRRQPNEKKRKDSEQENNSPDDEQSFDTEIAKNKKSASDGIDYCA
jgi:hypothetical protein